MDNDTQRARAGEHIAQQCMVRGCQAEASYWIDATDAFCETLLDSSLPHTFYLCLDHQYELSGKDEREGGYLHLRIDTGELHWIEIGTYACSPDCNVCRD